MRRRDVTSQRVTHGRGGPALALHPPPGTRGGLAPTPPRISPKREREGKKRRKEGIEREGDRERKREREGGRKWVVEREKKKTKGKFETGICVNILSDPVSTVDVSRLRRHLFGGC